MLVQLCSEKKRAYRNSSNDWEETVYDGRCNHQPFLNSFTLVTLVPEVKFFLFFLTTLDR